MASVAIEYLDAIRKRRQEPKAASSGDV